MIIHLTEDQFLSLPSVALNYPCDICCNELKQLMLMRSITDYCIIEDVIVSDKEFTALYLCDNCYSEMAHEYENMKNSYLRQQKESMSNEARWLRKVSKLSVQKLAKKIGVSRQAYYKWLRGKNITDQHKSRLKEIISVYIEKGEIDENRSH